MERKYFAAYGEKPADTMWSCFGYFKSLRDEKILKGDILNSLGNGIVAIDKEYLELFYEVFGRDKKLWSKLQKYKKNDEKLFLVRAEVEDLVKLNTRTEDLEETYPSLEFLIYDSDIE